MPAPLRSARRPPARDTPCPENPIPDIGSPDAPPPANDIPPPFMCRPRKAAKAFI